MASGDICFVVTASYTRTVNSLLPPGTLEEGGPPGRCDGSTCTYLLKSSVPCSPGDHYLWSFQQAAGVGVLSPLCRRGHVSGRVAFGPRPLPPWPCVCVCEALPAQGGGLSASAGVVVSRVGGARAVGSGCHLGEDRNNFCLRLPVFFRQHVREDVGLGTEERVLSPGPTRGISCPFALLRARLPACCR